MRLRKEDKRKSFTKKNNNATIRVGKVATNKKEEVMHKQQGALFERATQRSINFSEEEENPDPTETRVEEVMDQRGLGREAAIKFIKEEESNLNK